MAYGFKNVNSKSRRSKKRTIVRKYGPWCYYCGEALAFQMITIDHVKPVKRGGSNANTNLVPSCYRCNQRKGSKSPERFEDDLRSMR